MLAILVWFLGDGSRTCVPFSGRRSVPGKQVTPAPGPSVCPRSSGLAARRDRQGGAINIRPSADSGPATGPRPPADIEAGQLCEVEAGADMEIRQLRLFVAAAEELHFARAAARELVTPSQVSARIQALEREVGTRLFDRSTRQVRLTPAGDQLLVHARRILAEVDLARQHALRATVAGSRQLRLGQVILRMCAYFVPVPPARRSLSSYNCRTAGPRIDCGRTKRST